MARTAFLILLLLNFLMLAWIFLQGNARIDASREPQRALAQLTPEKIRIVSSPAISEEICRAFASPSLSDAQEAAKAWSGTLIATRILVNPVTPTKTYEIVIAGVKTRPLAESGLAELKSLGLTGDGEIRKESENRFTLVMASFNERAAAEQALKTLTARGLRLATIAEGQPTTEHAIIEVRGREQSLKKLTELAAAYKTFSPAICTP